LTSRSTANCAARIRNDGQLSLLLMDIDSFKAYNDHFGHQQGDACLTLVAEAFAATLQRPADLAARYGGEEFAAVLPDTGAGAGGAGGRNRPRAHRRAGHQPCARRPARPHVTMSIGVASFDKDRLCRRRRHAGRGRPLPVRGQARRPRLRDRRPSRSQRRLKRRPSSGAAGARSDSGN
jgi:diguanylate cyclase (GGDEF)-like protein